MIGPALLVVGGGVAGWLAGGWPGATAGVGVALLATFGVMAAAAWWSGQVGRLLDPATAWEVAPRPPLFRRLCEFVYRRALPPPAAAGQPSGDESDQGGD
jgi:hypothetical protein